MNQRETDYLVEKPGFAYLGFHALVGRAQSELAKGDLPAVEKTLGLLKERIERRMDTEARQ